MSERYGGVCECGNHAWARLTRGFVTLVSPEDAAFLSDRIWRAGGSEPDKRPYAIRTDHSLGRRVPRTKYLHRQVLALDDERLVDHASGNTLDNRRPNLRPCTHAENMGNQRVNKNNQHSGLKGVRPCSDGYGWMAFIASQYLGTLPDKYQAARAYDGAAVAKYGEFARTNASMGLL